MSSIREGAVIAGKYVLERPLAQGGMAAIWVGRHLTLGLPVAIKFMSDAVSATPDGRVRFEREARAVALLQGSNVVRIHDYGLHDGAPYMVMDLLRGEDLGRRLKARRRLPPAEAAMVVAQVAKALRRAHEAGVIHRDLKPANVFFAKDGDDEQVTVLDFGVAKISGSAHSDDVTRTDSVIGSVHYMSPEQARARKDIDSRSDLWSLGVVAFRMLTGQLPFGGEATTDVLVAICTEAPIRASQIVPNLGPDFDAFFARAFAKIPGERFQSADELAAAFAALVARPSLVDLTTARLPAPPPTLAMPPPVTEVATPPPAESAGTLTDVSQVSFTHPPRDRTRAPKLVAIAVSAALALVVVVVFVQGGPGPSPAATGSPEPSGVADPPSAAPVPPSPPPMTAEPALPVATASASASASAAAEAPKPPAPSAPSATGAPRPPSAAAAPPARKPAPPPAKKSDRLGLGF